MTKSITSTQNFRIKNIQKLRTKVYERRLQKLFIIEGVRELDLAILGKYIIDSIYIYSELFEKYNYAKIIDNINMDIVYNTNKAVFEKIAYRNNSQGILALAKPKLHLLKDLYLSNNPFVIVLESIEKPGNLGAILRTADAAKIDAVIICNKSTDIYNPSVIRTSIGCVFTIQIAIGSNKEIFTYLKKKSIQIIATKIDAFESYYNTNFTSSSAIIIGAEANGLTDFWINNAHKQIKIPMRGTIDSLNVSTSTAIIIFEAIRQRYCIK
ncbi:MAG: RNA methyltransferase [Bacteroidales bacterium OttesenSCG-928-I14]|jgi:TrmH family RNA methyltransferase|nr:RNA methyltransferase [Bacteroidales bacterium OttesenSCG-928-I14]